MSPSTKFNEILKALYSINNKKPNENSSPAKVSIKNVSENKFTSSFMAETVIVKQYKINHVISE